MAVIPSQILVAEYFNDKRGIAIGIATCGTGTGVLTLAPIARLLNDKLGWQNCHYILGK